MNSPSSGSATFAYFRILGNDLPPLHSPTQTLDNLRFVLEHEPPLEGCNKRFILNRIFDAGRLAQLKAVLTAAGHTADEIPFEPGAYRELSRPLARSAYLTNINPARNRALELAGADFVLPFDGQTYFHASGWERLRSAVANHPGCPAFVVPMVRLLENQEALQAEPIEREEDQGPSEPQIFFSRSCPDRFDASLPYGAGNKLEMLIRMGVPGPWNEWQGLQWKDLRSRPRSKQAGQSQSAGFVYRLASGNAEASVDLEARKDIRRESAQDLVSRVDEVLGL